MQTDRIMFAQHAMSLFIVSVCAASLMSSILGTFNYQQTPTEQQKSQSNNLSLLKWN